MQFGFCVEKQWRLKKNSRDDVCISWLESHFVSSFAPHKMVIFFARKVSKDGSADIICKHKTIIKQSVEQRGRCVPACTLRRRP